MEPDGSSSVPPSATWPTSGLLAKEKYCNLLLGRRMFAILFASEPYWWFTSALPLSHTPEPPSVWVCDEHQVHTEVEDITGSSQNNNSEKPILSVAKMILFWTTEHHRSHFQGIADSLLSVPISWVWNIWLYKYLLRAWDRHLLLEWGILLWKRRIAFVYTCHKQFC